MATSGEWNETALALRSAPGGNPWSSRHFARILELAEDDGLRLLKSYESKFDRETLRDLIRELLTSKLQKIVEADEPRPYFFVALKNYVRTYNRRGDTTVAETPATERDEGRHDPSSDRAFMHDARAVLSMLSSRDQQIVIAVAQGEEREVVARTFKTSRANVDQVVSRARKLFRGTREETPP